MDKIEIEKKLEDISDRLIPENISESERNEILSELDLILQEDPANRDAYFWKAMLYQVFNDYENAIAMYNEVLRINPDDEVAKEAIKDCTEFAKWKLDSAEQIAKIDREASIRKDSPDLLDKISVWHILIFKAIIIAIVAYFCFMPLISSFHDKKILEKANKTEQTQPTTYNVLNDKKPPSTGDFEDLRINPTSDYDYLTKQEIYDIRKRYVSESLFANDNYEPSEAVFGQIIDNKPWWGDTRCTEMNYHGDYHEHIEGDSKVSIQMNNPNALVGLIEPYIPWFEPEDGEYNGSFCTAEYSKFIPYSLKYNKKNNILVATYKVPRDFLDIRSRINGKNHRYIMQLSGLNARDFGYNHVWALESNNIKFRQLNQPTVEEEIQTFKDFIHKGGSCQYKDGCNNISPMQFPLQIKVTDLPAEINLKLWKNYPSNKYSKADMYYKIKFEEE